MRIVHCCLACFYNEGFRYQENLLPECHVDEGHQVSVLASTEVYTAGGKLDYIEPCEYVNDKGIFVKRLAYRSKMPDKLKSKLRYYEGVYDSLVELKPDLIFFHGFGGHGICEVAEYVKDHPSTIFLADSHEAYYNSASGFLSKRILHGTLNRRWVQKALPYIQKIYCVSPDSITFLNEMYGVPEEMTVFAPLGDMIVSDDEYESLRTVGRSNLHITEGEIVMFHSGKLDEKKRTSDLIEAFQGCGDSRFRLVIAGTFITPSVENKVQQAIRDDARIQFVGWADAAMMRQYLCASDLYIQPGTQSSTAQSAACMRCALALRRLYEYEYLYGDSVYYIEGPEDIADLLSSISANKDELFKKSVASYRVATDKLDYRELAHQISSYRVK